MLVSEPIENPKFDLNLINETWWIDVRRHTNVRLYASRLDVWTTATLAVYHSPTRGGELSATLVTFPAGGGNFPIDTTDYDWLAVRVTLAEGGAAYAQLRAVRKYDPALTS